MARAEEVEHGWMLGKLFTLKAEVPAAVFRGYHDDNGPVMARYTLRTGRMGKVVMVSRFGDCGITDQLADETGYIARVEPIMLSEVK